MRNVSTRTIDQYISEGQVKAGKLRPPLAKGTMNSMSTTTVHFATLEEFFNRPPRDDDQREELIEGELLVSPGAKVWHAALVRRFREQLAPLESHGYVLANDFAILLGGSMPVPDLAAVQQERWDQAAETDAWLNGCPELVIEVASPSNRSQPRKAALYLEHGAEQVWIAYPATRTIAVNPWSETPS